MRNFNIFDNLTKRWLSIGVKRESIPAECVQGLPDLVKKYSGIKVYAKTNGTAAKTTTPYYASRWDVTDKDVTGYTDGMVVSIRVPVAGNGSYGTVFQINNLGYHPVVYNISSMISTRYGVGSQVIAVYNSTQTATAYLGSGSQSVTGCWQVMDYDTTTSTSVYTMRNNASLFTIVSGSKLYRYRLCMMSADHRQLVPFNNSTSTSATAVKTGYATAVFDPFAPIYYYGSTTAVTSSTTNVGASSLYQHNSVTIGYSYYMKDLTTNTPLYIKAVPQSTGGAKLDTTTPIVTELPTTDDGFIYIYLGQTSSATVVELALTHPVYYHDGTRIRLYT